MQSDNMGKQRPKNTITSSSDTKMLFKPPIHRIAANSITKNTPIQKELFKLAIPVATARMQPNLIGDFVKRHAKKYESDWRFWRSDVWSGRKISYIINEGPTKLVVMDPKVQLESSFLKSLTDLDTNTVSETARKYMQEHDISLHPHTVTLDYDFWSVGTIRRHSELT